MPGMGRQVDPSTCKLRAHTLVLALQLTRMISCCRATYLQRSGMLLRCLHVLRHILAATPATPEVRHTPKPYTLKSPPGVCCMGALLPFSFLPC